MEEEIDITEGGVLAKAPHQMEIRLIGLNARFLTQLAPHGLQARLADEGRAARGGPAIGIMLLLRRAAGQQQLPLPVEHPDERRQMIFPPTHRRAAHMKAPGRPPLAVIDIPKLHDGSLRPCRAGAQQGS